MFIRIFIFIFSILLACFFGTSNVNTAEANTIRERIISPQDKQANLEVNFAKFLTKNNVVLYTAWWCSHCHDQKDLFSKEALKELNIVECSEPDEYTFNEVCKAKDITGTPSWEIDNQIFAGTQSLAELAELTNYPESFNFE